jgi:hypothetical protein
VGDLEDGCLNEAASGAEALGEARDRALGALDDLLAYAASALDTDAGGGDTLPLPSAAADGVGSCNGARLALPGAQALGSSLKDLRLRVAHVQER